MDRIVYLKISNGGGVDGRDASDKGGQVMAASFAPLAPDGWSHIEKKVIDTVEAKSAALKKLDPIDRLALDLK